MENLDLKLSNEELKTKMEEAVKSGDNAKQVEAMTELMQYVAQEATREAKETMKALNNDNAIMTARGAKLLTSEEVNYYSKVIEAMKTNSSLTNIEVTMPITIIDRVFEDLEVQHPLLSIIDFQNVTGMIETIVRTGDVAPAWWGKLTDAIEKELESGFEKKSVNLYKLSAFLPICKAHLDLGASWLDSFIRRFFVEALSLGLEDAIVAGTGKDQPIGMNRDLEGAVVEGVYPEKATVPISDLKPATIGALIAPLTNGGKRAVTKILMVVNPIDYLKRIFPATTVLTANGTYATNVLPFPTDVIQSASVEEGKAIVGLASKYFMGLGSSQKIEKSEEYHFLEDETVYLGKMYGNGFPVDNKAFINVDISGIPATELTADVGV